MHWHMSCGTLVVFYWLCNLFYIFLVEEKNVIIIICETLHLLFIIFFCKKCLFHELFWTAYFFKGWCLWTDFLIFSKGPNQKCWTKWYKTKKIGLYLEEKNAFFSYFLSIFQFTNCRHHHLCRLNLLSISEPFG